jgi:hypothetical protein
MKGLMQHIPDLEVVFVLPDNIDIEFSYLQIPGFTYYLDSNLFIRDVFFSRFEFRSKAMKKCIEKIQPDIIFCNDPCQVGGLRAVLSNLGFDIPIVSYNHWMDNEFDRKVPVYMTYYYRQVEGAIKSDLCCFNSDFAIDLFNRGVHCEFQNQIASKITFKSLKVPPPLDFSQFRPKKKFDKFTIIFSHRISSLPYYWTNWTRFLDLLVDSESDFDVIVTDPSGKLTDADKHKYYDMFPRIKNIGCLSYEAYLDKLAKSHMAVGLFAHKGMWSISLAEAIASKCATIIPNHSGYKELVPKNYLGLVDEQNARSVFDITINDDSCRNKLIRDAYAFAKREYDLVGATHKLAERVIALGM